MRIGAHFSEDRKYRYALWRIWIEDKPLVMFIGLNPSSANERKNDPTIRRVMRYAADWGYGGIYMMNLFAWVTPYPQELKKAEDPVGDNDAWLEKILPQCKIVVYVWGSFPEAHERSLVVMERIPGGYCLGKSKLGNPLHPLYLPIGLEPVLFKPVVP